MEGTNEELATATRDLTPPPDESDVVPDLRNSGSTEAVTTCPLPALSAEPDTAQIVVFGKDGTGKSALIVRLLTRRFIHEYDPTAEDVYAYNTDLDGRKVRLKIMDTAGLVERTVHKREEQIRWGDGFLLVLSLTSRDSLREVTRIRDVIGQVDDGGKPIVVVANMRDLVQGREVTGPELQELGRRWGCRVFETAATEDFASVARPFFALYREIRKRKDQQGALAVVRRLDREIVLADVNKRYRSRLFTR